MLTRNYACLAATAVLVLAVAALVPGSSAKPALPPFGTEVSASVQYVSANGDVVGLYDFICKPASGDRVFVVCVLLTADVV